MFYLSLALLRKTYKIWYTFVEMMLRSVIVVTGFFSTQQCIGNMAHVIVRIVGFQQTVTLILTRTDYIPRVHTDGIETDDSEGTKRYRRYNGNCA